ncbi:MAG: sigma-70 family RNA polymerase sigma factor [Deltaproteobacteria bacterium]|nr:sigma-70 family RNA polymerase sigma factor [Deltaproteobacteria bacterium]
MSAGKTEPVRSLSSDEEEFVEEQYTRHGPLVYRRCLMFASGDRDFAADATHDVFMRLMANASSLDRGANIAGWLLTVATRLCIDRQRRERGVFARVQAALAAEPGRSAPPSPERTVQTRRDWRHLWEALASLSAEERAAVVMKHLDGRSQTEIAHALARSEGQVSKLLKRAAGRLRDRGFEVGDG